MLGLVPGTESGNAATCGTAQLVVEEHPWDPRLGREQIPVENEGGSHQPPERKERRPAYVMDTRTTDLAQPTQK